MQGGRLRSACFSLVAVITALSGCAHLDHDLGTPLPMDALSDISVGSHYSEVLQRFGPPTKMSAMGDGMAFLYEHVALVEKQYGLILPGEIGRWIKAVYASADADVETVLFVFDSEGELLGYDDQSWGSDAGAGMSLTLIFSAGSFTDTEQYETSASRSLDWGKSLTMPPLITLNLEKNLETGANGLQMTTSSDAVGQHTLQLKSK